MKVCRALTETRPDAFSPYLAMSETNLSIMLSELGRLEESLTAIEEAVTIRRALAEARPHAFRPDLAGSLNNLSVMPSELGRRGAGRDRGGGDDPPCVLSRWRSAFRSALIGSLSWQAEVMGSLGRKADAEAVRDEVAGLSGA